MCPARDDVLPRKPAPLGCHTATPAAVMTASAPVMDVTPERPPRRSASPPPSPPRFVHLCNYYIYNSIAASLPPSLRAFLINLLLLCFSFIC